MRVNKILIKVFLVLSAIVVAVGALEIGLLLISRHYFGDQFALRSSPGEAVDIICLGNSFTAGVGAPPGKSYCHQMQQMAESRGYSLKIENWAYPMQNTSEIIQMLRRMLPFKSPKVAIVMAGEPNYVNFKGIGKFAVQGDSLLSYKLMAMDLLHRYSGAFRLYTLLQNSEVPTESSNTLPFSVKDEKDDLEIAYRWLAWGRTRIPGVELTAEQAAQAIWAADRIKDIDPTNYAADLFKADVFMYGLNDPDRALRVYQNIPRDLEVCLAVLEFSKKKASSRPEFAKVDRFLGLIRKKWAKKNPSKDLALLDRISLFRSDKDSFKDFHTNSIDAVLPQLLKISECGTPGDGLTHFLISYLRHQKNVVLETDLLAAHLKNFPMTDYIDVFSLLNSGELMTPPENSALPLKTILNNQQKLAQKIEKIRGDYRRKYGDRVESAASLNTRAIQKWIEFDLAQMNELLRANGIKVILMTYPPMRTPGPRPLHAQMADAEIRNVARGYDIPLFDTYQILRPIFLSKSYNEAFYSNQYGPLDNHLNAAGYGILAEKLLNYLEQNKMVKAL